MNTQSPEGRALLDAARAADDPSPADRARIDAAMQEKLAAHGIPLLTGAISSVQAPTAAGAPTLGAGSATTAAAGTALKVKLTGMLLAGALSTAGVIGLYGAFDPRGDAEKTAVVSTPGSTPDRAEVAPAQPATPAAMPGGGSGAARAVASSATQTPQHPGAQGVAEEVESARTPAAKAGRSSVRGPARGTHRRRPMHGASPARATQKPGLESSSGSAEAALDSTDPTPALDPSGTPVGPKAMQLREEMRLLGRARSELAAGAAERALQTLQQHAQQFEGGRLWQERMGLQALALCETGRVAAGRRVRAALLARAPNAIMAERVQRACGAPEPTETQP